MIKKMMQSIREYKKVTFLTSICMMLEVAMEITIPFLLAKLIDEGITQLNTGVIIRTGIELLIVAFLSLFFGVQSGRNAAKASAGFAKNLRQDMYEKVQQYSFFNIDKFSTSSIVTRLTTDVTNVQQAFMMIIKGAVRSPLTIIFAMIMSFKINANMALIFLVTAPILGGLLIFISRKAHPIFEKVFNTYDKLNNVVQENVKGIRVVKSFVKDETEINKFEKVSDVIYKYFTKAEVLLALNNPLMQFMTYTCITLISWFGSKYIIGGTLTTGELTSLITYIMQILSSLMMVSMIFVTITMAIESIRRIVEILEEVPDLKNSPNPIKEVKDGKIEFNNVSFSYLKDKNKLCLKNINLKINSGETVGIIGGTGSSKSTLVQLIPRLYDVVEGEIKVGGINVKDYDIKALRDAVSMVLQKNELFSGTIKENLRWGNKEATDEEVINASKLANAHNFIMNLPNGYDTIINESGGSLSQGQKQLLSIARAAMANPPVMILDEATSSIDTRTEKIVQDGMDKLMEGRTVFVIAHRLSTVKNSKAIIVLDHGKIIERGSHEELIAQKGMYYRLYTGSFELE